ncbi:MAG: tetratricopeptide repeat protein [Chitinivibrionales bacterium]|nr:tetratricopeptide repeat protein [Chitinivibrionales bacterium]
MPDAEEGISLLGVNRSNGACFLNRVDTMINVYSMANIPGAQHLPFMYVIPVKKLTPMSRLFSFQSLAFTCACALMLLTVRCAYFNTYYNGQTAFQQARKEHQELQQEHPDSNLALPSHITVGYDTAISKSHKVIKVYQKQKRWHDDAYFLMGRAHYYKGEYQAAIRYLRQVRTKFPQSTFVPRSFLYSAKAHMKDGNLNKAEEILARILDKYPHLNNNDEISLLMAEIAIQREGKAMAIELLEKVRKSITDEVKKMQLILKTANLYIDLKQYAKAIGLLKTAPRKKKLPELLYRIDYSILTCYMRMDSAQAALALTEEMIDNKLFSGHLSELLLRKAKILHRLDRIDEAIDNLERLSKAYEKYPIIGKVWLELALIYQKKKGNFEKAREYFEKARDSLKDEDLKELAAERFNALVALDSIRKPDTTHADTAAADTTESWGMEQFKVGEIFWLSLDEPDSALKYYQGIAKDTAIVPDSFPKAIYASAWITRNALKDTTTSDSLFELLISEYPNTEYAKGAQKAREERVTIMTKVDSAQAMYRDAELLLADDLYEAATEAYLEVADVYPENVYGAKSIYAAAWVNDHILEKNVTALRLYKKLCKEHPESEFCVDEARPRLDIVADTVRVRKQRIKQRRQRARRRTARPTKSARTSARGADKHEEDESEVTEEKQAQPRSPESEFPGATADDEAEPAGETAARPSTEAQTEQSTPEAASEKAMPTTEPDLGDGTSGDTDYQAGAASPSEQPPAEKPQVFESDEDSIYIPDEE